MVTRHKKLWQVVVASYGKSLGWAHRKPPQSICTKHTKREGEKGKPIPPPSPSIHKPLTVPEAREKVRQELQREQLGSFSERGLRAQQSRHTLGQEQASPSQRTTELTP